MKPKASRIALALFGLVCLASFREVFYQFSHPKPGASMLGLVEEQVVAGLIPLVFTFVGALIVSRQPRNLVGWLLFGPAIGGAIGLLLPDVRSWTTVPPQITVRGYLALWYGGWSWLPLIFPIFLIMLLFPTGRPPSPRWNWVGYLALGMVAVFLFFSTFSGTFTIEAAALVVPNPLGFLPELMSGPVFLGLWATGLLVLAVSGMVSLVVRYRGAAAIEREQIKWLVYACGLFGAFYTVSAIFYLFNQVILIDEGIYGLLTFLAMATIPIAIAIAILRYRLWDIDVIIRRTLVYAALSLTLALVYFGSVILLQSLVSAVGGQQSAVVTVISTLLIAALFTPLRRRIQNDIDRRFFRKKYDAEKTIAAFSAGLRQEVDLEQIGERLLSVVEDTMQPDSVSLWLKEKR